VQVPTNEQRRQAAKRKLERQLARRAERARRRRIIGVVITVVGVIAAVGLVYWLANLGDGNQTAAANSTDTSTPEQPADTPTSIPSELAPAPKRPTPLPATANCEYPVSANAPAAKPAQAPPTQNISAQGTVAVTMGLTGGDLKLTLDKALAPCTVNNFVSLAKQGYYNDTPCHRLVVTGLQVLQCGDPTGQGNGGPGYTFKDEVFPELKYGRGILAMANSGANTNGSQFFICYGAAELPPNYTAFGTIDADSLKIVDEIAKAGVVSQQPGQGDGAPKNPVKITQVTVAG
jgi:peptidyl-prolyl cis-trans isomerase B (cyclophilin B)